MGKEERYNLFCRTFLLKCQKMPVGLFPLDKNMIEWFRWHCWFDNEFSYFSFPVFCEEWHSAWLTLPGLAVSFLGQIPHSLSCQHIRVQAGYNSKDFQPTYPHCFTCCLPLSWLAQGTGYAYIHRWETVPKGMHIMRFKGGCQDVICAQSSASQAAPEPEPWQQ